MLALDSRDGLDAINTKMEVTMYRGRNAIRLGALPDQKGPDDVMMAFVRRNHSVQYESIPDFPWYRLRQENPGEYESYSDLDAGAWTRLKIVVTGTKARLYVNGSEQPCLIVNDLKLGESHGQVALWARWSTDAHFSNLTITRD